MTLAQSGGGGLKMDFVADVNKGRPVAASSRLEDTNLAGRPSDGHYNPSLSR